MSQIHYCLRYMHFYIGMSGFEFDLSRLLEVNSNDTFEFPVLFLIVYRNIMV